MFSRTLTNIGVGVALAAAAVLGTGAAAYAFECYNPSRSEEGNAGASNSQAWFTIVVDDAIQADADAGLITQEQADCLKAYWSSNGGPASFTIHVKGATGQDGVIAENNPNEELLSDGHGIDHLFEAYGDLIGAAYASCGVPL